MSEVNTALASSHFQNNVDVKPNLASHGQIATQCMKNTIGTYPGDIGSPMWGGRGPQMVEFQLGEVPN